MIRLDGKKVLITGGSRGIGRATALLFARAGADVAITYVRNASAAASLAEEVTELGQECVTMRLDVRQRKEVERLVWDLLDRWGRLDALVNNAGIWTYGEMGDLPETVWSETMKVNLDGVYHTCNAVVPSMKQKKEGGIINISSTAGVRGEAFYSHYAASKGALIALTKSLAAELGPWGIRVNCVAPGWVYTDMSREVFQDAGFKRKIEESIPLRRIPPPEDIAGPVLFLASDLARHITGEVLNVNGGSVLCA